MARSRFRRGSFRRTRTVYKTRTVKRSGSNFMNKPTVQGLIYGLIRPTATRIAQNAKSLPLVGSIASNLGDEAVLWGGATVVSKFSKGGIKSFAKRMQFAEIERVSEQGNLLNNLGGIFTSNNQTTNAAVASPNNGQASF